MLSILSACSAANTVLRQRTSQGVDIRRGCTANAVQNRAPFDFIDHAVCLVDPKRCQSKRYVAKNFDQNSTKAKHHGRTEERIAYDSSTVSTPPSTISATNTPSMCSACSRPRVISVLKPSHTACSPATPTKTPPMSLLWAISGDAILSTTLPSNCSAMVAASAAVVATHPRGVDPRAR